MSTLSDGTRFAGAHSDGRTATTSPVSVRFTGGGLELRGDSEMTTRVWPYDQLLGSVPLRADAADVLLSLKPDGAETLFVADPSFARLLLARAPALSRGAPALAGSEARPRRPRLGRGCSSAVSGCWTCIRSQTIARFMPQKTRAAWGPPSSPRWRRTAKCARRRRAKPRSTG